MSYEATLLTLQTVIQLVGLAGASYVVARWQIQQQGQSQSQHLHVHGGSFDATEVEEER